MIRPFIAALAFTLPLAPLAAQAIVPAGHGATAGRSPHHAYRTTEARPNCGRPALTVPSGKLPTYGRHGLESAPCPAAEIASADAPAKAGTRE